MLKEMIAVYATVCRLVVPEPDASTAVGAVCRAALVIPRSAERRLVYSAATVSAILGLFWVVDSALPAFDSRCH